MRIIYIKYEDESNREATIDHYGRDASNLVHFFLFGLDIISVEEHLEEDDKIECELHHTTHYELNRLSSVDKVERLEEVSQEPRQNQSHATTDNTL